MLDRNILLIYNLLCMSNHYYMTFDGSCWPNPNGKAGYGYVLRSGDDVIDYGSGEVGNGIGMSNNVAEYFAFCKGVEAFLTYWDREPAILHIAGDSDLVVQQVSGKKRAFEGRLYYKYYLRAMELVQALKHQKVKMFIKWIPREENTECDELSKEFGDNMSNCHKEFDDEFERAMDRDFGFDGYYGSE
jgi:ribonuclease HI